MNSVIECIKSRRSTKSFSAVMPKQTLLGAVVDTARYAPSGMNRQSWHFTVVTNKPWLQKVTKKLGVHLGRGENYCCYYNAPALVIVSASEEFPTSEADCACAIENMYIAAVSLNLGACWINQLGKSNCPVIRDELTEAGVPETDLVYGCIALGYPVDGYTPKEKILAENTVKYFK